MCGIAGIWTANAREAEERAEHMASQLAHRGPDGWGIAKTDGGPVFAHRRLSILDVSEAGAQPMASRSGRFTLCYNGEIYNHLQLRQELPRDFEGHSDTETLLASLEEWGIERTLARINGMFAFAAWDARERQLYLARDRMGIKPLYVLQRGETFAFASELSAFAGFGLSLDPDSVAAYLQRACVPGQRAIFRNTRKFPGAHWARLSASSEATTPRRYWSVEHRSEDTRPIESLLRDSVSLRLLSDVPVGVFLSGGIDSSVVTALAQEVSATPISTFSIGFDHGSYDESELASAVAKHLGTVHHTLRMSEQDALDAVEDLSRAYAEPFADSSQIPTLLLCRFARQHVTVALSGDGGDEVFGGYTRHLSLPRIIPYIERLPRAIRPTLGKALGRLSQYAAADGLGVSWVRRLVSLPEEKLRKLAIVVENDELRTAYAALTDCWHKPGELVDGVGCEPPMACSNVSPLAQLRRWDLENYLTDDILVKVDRASMAVGLEARVPLLDHKVVEAGFALTDTQLVDGGQGKLPLRELLKSRVPASVLEHPKSGFAVPLAAWLRGPLRDWAQALVASDLEDVCLDSTVVRSHWRAFLRGEQTHHRMWTVLMLVNWYRANLG